MPRRILVTSALPYANGHIHLGHLVEYIQTDIWVRFQKLTGQQCVYICADDTHGTAIMIRARQEGRSETALIADMKAAHERDFAGFQVAFDHYGSTNSDSNRKLCAEFWAALRKAGLVVERSVEQLYDPVAGTFLADRFIKGTCPKCKSPDQYGDSCDKCGSTYSPTELIDPRSTLSGAAPELRAAHHWFVQTEQSHEFLDRWTQEHDHLHPDVANWLKAAFLAEPLRDWDVTRPAPYFGFELPDAPGNYWYVWFDAPIGYLASTADWCAKHGEDFLSWWKNPTTEVHHFIGKDITYFHTLFWPVMLKAAGYNLPHKVHIHGFLTVDGEKMSKTKGTFIRAATYLNYLDPAWLRYFYASKLGPKLDDLDLNLEEFTTKVNSDLVGKIVNLASRTAHFVETLSAKYPDDGGLFAAAAAEGETIAAAYEACDFNKAMRHVMALADKANEYVDAQAPWKLKKDPAQADKLRDVCTIVLNLYRQLVVYLAPVLPRLTEQSGTLLGDPIVDWRQAQQPLVGAKLAKFEHLMTRIDPKQVQAMIDASREETPVTPAAQASSSTPSASSSAPTAASSAPAAASSAAAPSAWNDTADALANEPLVAERITIDQFTKVDLRVARVIAAEEIPKAKKLLKLTLSLGGEERRNVFAGIKSKYKAEELVGRLVVMVANLEPRQMTFGISEGMVTAAGAGGEEIYLLAPDSGAKPGQRVH
ncbi:MAG: methionine--tRNA ligase [Planctomycetes bacterium]|nr:methionine--tRNA ligase [Planctomycetota bacterium]